MLLMSSLSQFPVHVVDISSIGDIRDSHLKLTEHEAGSPLNKGYKARLEAECRVPRNEHGHIDTRLVFFSPPSAGPIHL